MSKEKKKSGGPKGAPEGADLGVSQCRFDECSKKAAKFGFCSEHYELYMSGVIRGDGKKPSDFSEKLSRYLLKKEKSRVA